MSENDQDLRQQADCINNLAASYAASLGNIFNITGVIPGFRMLVGIHLAASSGIGVKDLEKDKFVETISHWWDEYQKMKVALDKRFSEGQAN